MVSGEWCVRMEGREGRERRQNPAPHKVPRSVRWSHLAVACAVEGDRVEGRGEVEGRSIGVRRVVARPLGPRHEVRTEARVLGVVVGEGGDPRLVGVGGAVVSGQGEAQAQGEGEGEGEGEGDA